MNVMNERLQKSEDSKQINSFQYGSSVLIPCVCLKCNFVTLLLFLFLLTLASLSVYSWILFIYFIIIFIFLSLCIIVTVIVSNV